MARRTVNTDELAQCQTQIAEWVAKRNRLIRDAHNEGQSLRTIAAVAGLSHAAIAKILKSA